VVLVTGESASQFDSVKSAIIEDYKLVKCVAVTSKKLRGLSPQANYTDRATAACQ
jgi:hypothetical protein